MSEGGRTIVFTENGAIPPSYEDVGGSRHTSRSSDANRSENRHRQRDESRRHRSRHSREGETEDRTRDSRGDRHSRRHHNRAPVTSQPVPIRPDRQVREDSEEKDDRYVVPALPLPLAILCCILNFLVPGLGSMTAAIGVLCCANTDDMTCGQKCGSCCTVFGIGILQLLLTVCFLIGWIWSCIWGITFIGMSLNYYKEDFVEANIPPWERNIRGRTPLPTPEVVPHQPYPGIGYAELQREQERRRRHRERHRRARSRISLSSSNLIYPMRAPSNISYNSPPPPYQHGPSESPPGSRSRTENGTRDLRPRSTTLQPLPEVETADNGMDTQRSRSTPRVVPIPEDDPYV